jgi:cyclopropane-fatty-acyl-phospholipid synthase
VTDRTAPWPESAAPIPARRPLRLDTLFLPLLERGLLPDALIRLGIRRNLAAKLAEEAAGGVEAQSERRRRFVAELDASPIAIHTTHANAQHYEVPTGFFQLVLGPHLKYSSGLWAVGVADLAGAERAMLELTAARAALADGQRILELGCGWGSLTLFMAERYPRASITAVSNSRTQREHIEAECRRRGFSNVTVITADMNDFEAPGRYDRVVSVEMFEHMKNYRALMRRIASWLEPGGALFVHIFTHREFAYPYEVKGEESWIDRHFFTGGNMPSDTLLLEFQDDLAIEERWRVDGRHYAKTAEAWLANMDRHRAAIRPLLADTYGPRETERWWNYWRVFFIACAELWSYRGGQEWMVSHYRFRKRAAT